MSVMLFQVPLLGASSQQLISILRHILHFLYINHPPMTHHHPRRGVFAQGFQHVWLIQHDQIGIPSNFQLVIFQVHRLRRVDVIAIMADTQVCPYVFTPPLLMLV